MLLAEISCTVHLYRRTFSSGGKGCTRVPWRSFVAPPDCFAVAASQPLPAVQCAHSQDLVADAATVFADLGLASHCAAGEGTATHPAFSQSSNTGRCGLNTQDISSIMTGTKPPARPKIKVPTNSSKPAVQAHSPRMRNRSRWRQRRSQQLLPRPRRLAIARPRALEKLLHWKDPSRPCWPIKRERSYLSLPPR